MLVKDAGNTAQEAHRLIQHANCSLSPLPSTVQVPASRAWVLSGWSRETKECDWFRG